MTPVRFRPDMISDLLPWRTRLASAVVLPPTPPQLSGVPDGADATPRGSARRRVEQATRW